MTENQLSMIFNNILQQKSNEMQNNEIFSMVSLITLIQIVDLFKEKTVEKNISSTNNKSLPDNTNLNSLLNQLDLKGTTGDDNSGNSNMQQIIPLLLKLLGNKNNLDKILNLLNPGPKGQNNNGETPDESKPEEEKTVKKKTLLRKRA